MKLIRTFFGVTYQKILKPILFTQDAETVHNLFTSVGSLLGRSALLRGLTRFAFSYQHAALPKTVDGIRFANPIGLSAGFDYNAELTQILPAVGFGFETVGTVTLNAYEGNATPRLQRFPKSHALLVNKGFKNIGAKAVIKKLTGKKFEFPVGISIGSTNQIYKTIKAQIDDITACFQLFEKSKVKHSYYELNISCPNTTVGQPFTDPKNLDRLLRTLVRLRIHKPVYIKMPIDLDQKLILELLKVADHSFVHGVVFGNLTKDKKNPLVHPDEQKLWSEKKGNVSGKPTWDRSNTLIALTKKHYGSRFTIIGTGGVFSGADAAEKIRLGADLVQLITGMVYKGPQLIGDINDYLAHQS
jgi:dihydroorotate dehydrogenase subfamily 2